MTEQTLSLFTMRWDISDPRDISPSRENFVPGSHENWVGYYPLAIQTRHNNTGGDCILNVQNGVQQKLCFISFLDTFSFCCCSISIKWISSSILCVFTFGICNFRHVGFHVRILPMRITVEVSKQRKTCNWDISGTQDWFTTGSQKLRGEWRATLTGST